SAGPVVAVWRAIAARRLLDRASRRLGNRSERPVCLVRRDSRRTTCTAGPFCRGTAYDAPRFRHRRFPGNAGYLDCIGNGRVRPALARAAGRGPDRGILGYCRRLAGTAAALFLSGYIVD